MTKEVFFSGVDPSAWLMFQCLHTVLDLGVMLRLCPSDRQVVSFHALLDLRAAKISVLIRSPGHRSQSGLKVPRLITFISLFE